MIKNKSINKLKAVTLVEILIALVLIGILAGLSVPLLKLNSIDYDLYKNIFFELRRANGEIVASQTSKNLGADGLEYCQNLIDIINTTNATCNSGTSAFYFNSGAYVFNGFVFGGAALNFPLTLEMDLDGPSKGSGNYLEDVMQVTVFQDGRIIPGTNGADAAADDFYNSKIRASVHFGGCDTTAAIRDAVALAISSCTVTRDGPSVVNCTSMDNATATSFVNTVNAENTTPEPNLLVPNVEYDIANTLKTAIETAGGRAEIRYIYPKTRAPSL